MWAREAAKHYQISTEYKAAGGAVLLWGGTQVPFCDMRHTSHHQSHLADFKVAAEVCGEGRKRGMSPCSSPMGSLGCQDRAWFLTQVQPPYPRKNLSPVLCSQTAGPGVHQVMRRKLETLCMTCSPLIICHGSKHHTINGWTMDVTYFNAWRKDDMLRFFRWCFKEEKNLRQAFLKFTLMKTV